MKKTLYVSKQSGFLTAADPNDALTCFVITELVTSGDNRPEEAESFGVFIGPEDKALRAACAHARSRAHNRAADIEKNGDEAALVKSEVQFGEAKSFIYSVQDADPNSEYHEEVIYSYDVRKMPLHYVV